jgi:uncharacterized protein HemY
MASAAAFICVRTFADLAMLAEMEQLTEINHDLWFFNSLALRHHYNNLTDILRASLSLKSCFIAKLLALEG